MARPPEAPLGSWQSMSWNGANKETEKLCDFFFLGAKWKFESFEAKIVAGWNSITSHRKKRPAIRFRRTKNRNLPDTQLNGHPHFGIFYVEFEKIILINSIISLTSRAAILAACESSADPAIKLQIRVGAAKPSGDVMRRQKRNKASQLHWTMRSTCGNCFRAKTRKRSINWPRHITAI